MGVERTIRQLEAVAVAIVTAADRRELFRDDGHVSVRGWVNATIRVSDVEVTHRVRTAKLTTGVAVCREALRDGRLGLAQVRELARAYANPRCGDQLADVADELVDIATSYTYEIFGRAVRHWNARRRRRRPPKQRTCPRRP